jgi:hypothetical protein
MAFKATGIGDLTPDQLRAFAEEYRAAATSSAYPATAASLLRLAKRYDELAAERRSQSGKPPMPSVPTTPVSMAHCPSDGHAGNRATQDPNGNGERA